MRPNATWYLVLLTAITSSLLSADVSAQTTSELIAGDLVKSASSSAVYEVASDSTRLVFQMQSVYESWYGKNFSAVKTVDASVLASLPVRRVKSFKVGSVVKSPSLPTVYLVSGDLELTAIPSEKVFHSLGKSFTEVRDIPDGFFTSYRIVGTLPDPDTQTTTSTPPVVEEPPVALDIVTRSFTASTKTAGDVRVETTAPSNVKLSYRPIDGSALESITRSSAVPATKHSFALSNLSPRSKYAYTLTVSDSQGHDLIEESGTFVTYYDLYVSAHSSAPETGSLRQENVEVGRFFVYNNSTLSQTVQELWFSFNTVNAASDAIAKTIELIDVTPGSPAHGTVLSYKNVGAGTSIRNSLQAQKFTFLDITIAPGAQRVIAVVIKGLENMDIERMESDSFVTKIDQMILGGDAEVYTQTTTIGTRYNSK